MFGVLVLLTGVVTVLFSYVGTICVAVLAGMMIGTLPRSIWLALRVGFVFPAVMLAMLQLWRVELEFPRQLMMGGLSFAMFWAVYLLTLGVMCLEARSGAAGEAAGASSAGDSVGAEGTGRSEEGAGEIASGLRDRSEDTPAIPIILQWLEGEWCCEVVDLEGRRCHKVFRVAGDQFSLAVTPANGDQSEAVRGHLKFGESDRHQTPTLLAVVDDRQNRQSEPTDAAGKMD